MLAIKTVNLTKKYKDVTAVDKLNLEIKKGELYALLGLNGAGKTTLIKILTTLCEKSSGEAYVLEKSVSESPFEIKKIIGLSPQETAVASALSVRENLELMCDIYGYSKEEKAQKIERVVEIFSLESVMNKRAGKLSGGMKRRLSIALALIGEPEIIFLDEPTLGVDVLARSELWDRIRALKGDKTIILTTHYLEEAEALSDRIGIMNEGKLIAEGTAEELKKKAGEDKFDQAFIKLVKEAKI